MGVLIVMQPQIPPRRFAQFFKIGKLTFNKILIVVYKRVLSKKD